MFLRYWCISVAVLALTFNVGCLGGAAPSTHGKSQSSARSLSPNYIDVSGTQVSGNGEGYGGIGGEYYAFGFRACSQGNNASNGTVELKSILEISNSQNTLRNVSCSTPPSSQMVPDNSIFSASHNTDVILYETGDVFERETASFTPSASEPIHMFCRGKRVANEGWASTHYQEGIYGFQTSTPEYLWVDFTVRVIPDNPYDGGLLDGQYNGEILYQYKDIATGMIMQNSIKGFQVDHWIRSHSNDYLSSYGVLGIDLSVNTDDQFFPGRLTFNVPGDIVMADMVCTQGVK